LSSSFCGYSLLGKVSWISDIVDNQRSHGAKVARFMSFDLKPDRCVVLHQNNSYHHLTEDREPRPINKTFLWTKNVSSRYISNYLPSPSPLVDLRPELIKAN